MSLPIDPATRAAAKAALAEALAEADAVESARADRRGRALLALGIMASGLAMQSPVMSPVTVQAPVAITATSAPAQHAPLLRSLLDAQPGDTWNDAGISAYVDHLNARFDGDPALSGKVTVVDSGASDEDAMVEKVLDGLKANGTVRERVMAGDLDFEKVRNNLYAVDFGQALATESNPESAGYHCFAVGVTAAEKNTEFMGIMSRAGADFDYRTIVSSELAHKITIAHETGHCAMGLAKGMGRHEKTDLHARMTSEYAAETYAILQLLQDGVAPEDLTVLADLRDMRLGFAMRTADENPMAYSVSHDLGPVIRAVLARAEVITGEPGFSDMTPSALADLAREILADITPTVDQVAAMDAAFQTIRDLRVQADAGEDVRDAVSALTDLEAVMAARFDAAYRNLAGRPSPLASAMAVANAPGSDAAIAGAEQSQDIPLTVPAETPDGSHPYQNQAAPARGVGDPALVVRLDDLVDGNQKAARGLAGYIDRLIRLETPAVDAARIALDSRSVRAALPGFSLFGLDSPVRAAAKTNFVVRLAEEIDAARAMAVDRHDVLEAIPDAEIALTPPAIAMGRFGTKLAAMTTAFAPDGTVRPT